MKAESCVNVERQADMERPTDMPHRYTGGTHGERQIRDASGSVDFNDFNVSLNALSYLYFSLLISFLCLFAIDFSSLSLVPLGLPFSEFLNAL